MKKVVAIAVAGGMAFSVTACGNSTSTTNGSQGQGANTQTEIKMQIAWPTNTGRGQAIERVVKSFEKANPNIKVDVIGGSQSGQALLTTILSGQSPDVLQVAYQDLSSLAPQGAFVDLTKQLSSDQSHYYPQVWNQAVVNGKVYGLPWLGHTIELVYNKTLFDKAGIKNPPQTWAELYADAKKLTNPKKNQYGLGLVGKQSGDITWLTDMFIHQAGGTLVQKGSNGKYQVSIDSPQSVQALNFYKKMVDTVSPPNTLNNDDAAVETDFLNQVDAMEFIGPWGVSDVWQNGNKFKVGAALAPAGPAGRAADIATYVLAIPTGEAGAKLDAATKLIEFMGTKNAQQDIGKGAEVSGQFYPFRIPIRNDLANMPYFKQHPEFLPFIQGLQYPSISSPIPQWDQINTEIYESALNQAVSGKMSAESALKLVQQKGNAVLQQTN